MHESSIEVVNNSAFSIEQDNFVTRQSNENLEKWCDRIINTLVPNKTKSLIVNAFYPVNPFVKCYYLTNSFSMKTAKNISFLTGLNIKCYSTFKPKDQSNLDVIDCIFIIGSKPGFLSEDAIDHAKNLNRKIQKDKKVVFCGNEDLLNFLNFENPPIRIDYSPNFLNKENLIDSTHKLSETFFSLFDNNFKNLILKNKLLQKINVKINSKNNFLKNNIKNSKLHVIINENICKFYTNENKKLELIGTLPFIKIKKNNVFIFNWFSSLENKSKILEIISPNSGEKNYLKIIEKKISKKILIWLNIYCFLHITKDKSLDITSLKINDIEYTKTRIFKNLLDFIDENM